MQIIKSKGNTQSFNPQKIWKRIKDQSKDLSGVKDDILFQKVIPAIHDGMTTTQIDEIIAHKSADMTIEHPDYALLGGRILMTRQSKLIGKEIKDVDLTYDFFAAITFLKKYSMKNEKEEPTELPSMMYERVANALYENGEDRDELYEMFSQKKGSLATPILTNAGSGKRNNFISCNLTMNIGDDSNNILDTLKNISLGSREGAGIGLCIDNLRSKDSLVSSFNGNAGGVVRYADMVQSHMRFFKQGTRSGSCALYLSVWHRDILDFLELRLPIGDESLRARDLFTAVTINDLFMKCLIEDRDWYLFCPNDVLKAGLRPLQDLWGEEFENEYQKAVDLGIGLKINPKRIWDAIIRSCVESGTPYVFYKDNANRNNRQSNLGVVKQSNLCVAGETLILTDKGYIRMDENEGNFVNAWNGEEFSEVQILCTGRNVYCMKVFFNDNKEIIVTGYHKFYIEGEELPIEAVDLEVGDKLQEFCLPDGTNNKLYVKDRELMYGRYDVYCVKEPKRGRVIYNGVETSNCAEIVQYSSPGNDTAQCTLASVCLKYNKTIEEIRNTTRILCKALNRVLDITGFPDKASKKAGNEQRAIAIGVSGLADFFAEKGIAFNSSKAREWNKQIFHAMMGSAKGTSRGLAVRYGNYPAWKGSDYEKEGVPMRNSLLIGLMPTASTSILLGANEMFEPFNSNIFVRNTGSGEFLVVNRYLVEKLESLGLWNQEMQKKIVGNEGSVQNIEEIPLEVREIFKTVWEIPMRDIIDMAADRQKFVDQSQSMNLYFKDAEYSKISGALKYAWEKGLKTGVYYTRTKSKLDKPKRLYDNELPQKPKDSPFECFGCES